MWTIQYSIFKLHGNVWMYILYVRCIVRMLRYMPNSKVFRSLSTEEDLLATMVTVYRRVSRGWETCAREEVEGTAGLHGDDSYARPLPDAACLEGWRDDKWWTLLPQTQIPGSEGISPQTINSCCSWCFAGDGWFRQISWSSFLTEIRSP